MCGVRVAGRVEGREGFPSPARSQRGCLLAGAEGGQVEESGEGEEPNRCLGEEHFVFVRTISIFIYF